MAFIRSKLLQVTKMSRNVCCNLSSSRNLSCQEISVPVPWGHIAGKWWGRSDRRPILTIHGWQDNCGSFNRLIPLLDSNDVGFLAIDLPGHGYSSRLPPGMYYHFINYPILIQYLVNYFSWPKVSLMGHSMGGNASFVYSTIFPDKVDFVICIDGFKPATIEYPIEHMSEKINEFFRYDAMRHLDEPPSYSMDEIKKRVCTPNSNSILPEYSKHIIERNVAPSKLNPGKYYFTRDPRLKCYDLIGLPQKEIVEYSSRVKFPIFVAKAKSASFYEPKRNYFEVIDVVKKNSKACQFHYVEGTHHVHLNNPEELGQLVSCFIKNHDVEDRSIGGLKEESRLTTKQNV